MELMDSTSGVRSPFCGSVMEGGVRTSCTNDLSAVGSCNLVQYRYLIGQYMLIQISHLLNNIDLDSNWLLFQ